MNSKNNSSSPFFQNMNTSGDSLESIFNNINNVIIDKLIEYVIKKHDEGITFEQIKHLIKQRILQLNQSEDKLLNWLIKNQDTSQYNWILGLFYYHNIGIDENSNQAFELFLKAAEDNYPMAQVYLARCYCDGYGIKCNEKLAFHWYQKSVENKSIIGQFYLGYCCELGIGIQQNEKKSVYWYQKATSNGNTTANLYLANCYRLGKGIEKNNNMAFNYYKILAEKEISDAQYQLGNCFYNGIGTKKDKVQACCWYKKAAYNGDIIAKVILKKYYNKKLKVEINKTKEIKFQKILNFKELSQHGLKYLRTKLTKKSYDKGYNYMHKSENKTMQVNLNIHYFKRNWN